MIIACLLATLGVASSLRILVDSDYYPLSQCNAQNNTNFTGFEFDIVIQGLKRMGLKEGADYSLVCSKTGTPTFDDFVNSLLLEKDAVLIAGTTITSDRVKAGKKILKIFF